MITDQIIAAESGGNPFARNPRSSATGPGQFINSTWLNLVSKYRPDLAAGKSSEEILALRTDPVLSKAMVDAYSSENGKFLSGAGFEVNPGNTYLAHFAGPQGAVNLLRADPTAHAGTILGDAVVKANPFLANMSAGDLIAWAGSKVGTGSPPVAPTTAAPNTLATTKTEPAGLLGGMGATSNDAGLLSNENALKMAFAGLNDAAQPQGLLPMPAIPDMRRKITMRKR